jgi:translation initiation factor IF-2
LGADVNVMRNGKPVATRKITQLQSNKQNTKDVTSGNECGMKVEGTTVIEVGDQLIGNIKVTKLRKLEVGA